ncbi:hypothetical protein V6C27_08870 [Peptococcaceae bacterium 1198_IL3148]
MRTWYIEDAGGGCQAFSEVLVLVSEEPQEIYTVEVPITWDEKIGLEEVACKLVIDMMKKAGVTKEDQVLVCSGNVFHTLHQWLEQEGYNWSTSKMDGLAHNVAENAFYQQLIKAGVPPEFKLEGRDYRSFYHNVETWVKEQSDGTKYLKDREARQKPAEQRYKLKSTFSKSRKCRGCGGIIKAYSPLVEHRFREQGKRHRHYYHPECSPVEPLKCNLEYATATMDGNQVQGLLLPFKSEASPCPVCGQPIKPGEKIFYGYLDEQLVYGHIGCFELF